MSLITAERAALLSAVHRPGGSFAAGRCELQASLLEVDGVGQVALPFLPAQADQLLAAEPVP